MVFRTASSARSSRVLTRVRETFMFEFARRACVRVFRFSHHKTPLFSFFSFASRHHLDDDGTPDKDDNDSDGDGIPDSTECPTQPCIDTDSDGKADNIDVDSDNDTLEDGYESGCSGSSVDSGCTPRDTDGDGTPDHLETDSDDDGTPDEFERGSHHTYDEHDVERGLFFLLFSSFSLLFFFFSFSFSFLFFSCSPFRADQTIVFVVVFLLLPDSLPVAVAGTTSCRHRRRTTPTQCRSAPRRESALRCRRRWRSNVASCRW